MSSDHLNSTPLDEQTAARLRQAVRSQPVPPELAVKIRQRPFGRRVIDWVTFIWMTMTARVICIGPCSTGY